MLPGDGIGPEIIDSAAAVLAALGGVDTHYVPIGGCSIDEFGVALTPAALERCEQSDAVLLGAVGGPRWDSTDPTSPRPEQGLLALRKKLGKGGGLYANLRPVKPFDSLLEASPLRHERIVGTDLLIVRELTGGIYYGTSGRTDRDNAFDTCTYSRNEIRRVAKCAFEAAQNRNRQAPKVTSVDKANVMETSRLWREVVTEVSQDFEDVELEHLLVDNAAMRLVSNPQAFDVLLTENTFGDILSDEAAMLTGSLGMLPSASIDHYPPGLFEPIHGSAPDIAGKGIANPLGTILSVALMFAYGLLIKFPDAPKVASAIEEAVNAVLDEGYRTRDLVFANADSSVKVVGTEEMTEAVIDALDVPHGWNTRAHDDAEQLEILSRSESGVAVAH